MPKAFAIMVLETTVTRYYIHAWPEESPFDAELRLRGYSSEGRARIEQDVIYTHDATLEVATVKDEGS